VASIFYDEWIADTYNGAVRQQPERLSIATLQVARQVGVVIQNVPNRAAALDESL